VARERNDRTYRAHGRCDWQGGHVDFAEQFPYDRDRANALLKEARFDHKNLLCYTLRASVKGYEH
jgi:hypothetical protein